MQRLNKFLAHAGVGSRRHCDDLIAAGRVKINGQVVRDLGIKVDSTLQQVAVDDQPVRVEKPTYWVVHKPPGYLCTNHDPAKRPLAIDLIPHVEQRVYTVGRLDEASEGMLLMTNDGELANALMHPRYGVEKTYLALVAGKPAPQDLQQLVEGVWIAEGKVKAVSAKRVRSQGESTWIRVVLAEGKNREIRRMLAKLDHKVLKLRRIAIGTVELDRLPKGKSRRLTAPEVAALQRHVEQVKAKVANALETKSTRPPMPASTPSRPPMPGAAPAVPPRRFSPAGRRPAPGSGSAARGPGVRRRPAPPQS